MKEKIEISVIHIKEIEILLSLLARYKDELPKELIKQLLLINTLEG